MTFLRPLRHRCTGCTLLLALVLGAASSVVADGWNVAVTKPGVYRLSFEELEATVDQIPSSKASTGLKASHRGISVPLWIVDDGDGTFGTGDEIRWVAARSLLWPRRLHDVLPKATLRLERASAAPPAPTPPLSPSGEETATVLSRQRIFEEDRVRAPLDSPALAEAVGSPWFWAPLSHQQSSAFGLDLGDLGDRADQADLGIAIDLLGWTHPDLPEAVPHHRVEVWLDGRRVGDGSWRGRQRHRLRLRVLADSLAGAGRLELRIPARRMPDSEDPLIDLVYVDRVEVTYRVDLLSRHGDNHAPWIVEPSAQPTWLADPEARAGERLYANSGWSAQPDPDRGWWLPARREVTEVWLANDATLQRPSAVTTVTPAPALPPAFDYLMIAPADLLLATERLATAHRQRGLRVAVAELGAIADHFGFGETSAAAVRAFLDHAVQASPELRFVLLVGDADWFLPPHGEAVGPSEHNRIPTRTYFSAFGPAATDHFFAATEDDPSRPRFALGRLPVADAIELDTAIDKILRHLEGPAPEEPPRVLLVSDQSSPSLGRIERSQQRLSTNGLQVDEVAAQGEALDEGLIAALDQRPAAVLFSGHGSRHSWQLGGSHEMRPDSLFDRADLARLSPTTRPPMVVSVSCTTAPFDHPSASSLGEEMVLAADRGALAFVGASSRLYTRPRFGEAIIEGLLAGLSIGEAMVAAKGELDHPEVSRLYNLLGDPALTLDPTPLEPVP
ncbi:MAG: C25 family cysteine peptidase [Acidobacteriota bacterium]